jgi:uncharacterized membrane protein
MIMSDKEIKEQLEKVLRTLESVNIRLKSIERQLSVSPGPGTTPPPQAPPLRAPAPPPVEPASPAPPPAAIKAPTAAPTHPVPPPPLAAADKVVTEKRIGVWLSRIGVVLVFLAVAFFLKIAYDHLGNVGKASLGVLIGVAFLLVGEIMEWRRYSPLARALTGGGLMILYLALFACSSYFKLVGVPIAFGLMVLVTATGVTLSIRYDSQVILILALIGGFVTPPLLSTGTDRQIVLMSYMMVLDFGLIGVAYWRKWQGINLLCFIATLVLFLGWWSKFYIPDKFVLTFGFATAFFIIFALASHLHGLLRKERATTEDLLLIALNAVVYFGGMYLQIQRSDQEAILGPYALAISIFYFFQSRAALAMTPEDNEAQRFLTGLAVAFLTLAIPLQLDYESVTLVWAMEAAALTLWGLSSRNDLFYYGGLAVLGMAVVHLFTQDFLIFEQHLRRGEDAKLMFAIAVTFLAVLIAAGLVISAHLRYRERLNLSDQVYISAYVFELVLFMVFLLVLNHYSFSSGVASAAGPARDHRGEILNISLILGIYSSILVAAGIFYRLPWLRYFGLPFLGFTLLKVVIYDLKGLNMSYRVVSFLALGLLLIGLSFLYNKYKDRLEGMAVSDPGKKGEKP